MLTTIHDDAAALYDGGWRKEDHDDLMKEYELTEEEADQICEELEKIQKDIDDGKTMYEASLSNESGIFDNDDFVTVKDAIAWVTGRGGNYVLNISSEKNEMGVNVSIHDYDEPEFAIYDGWDWQKYTKEELVDFLEGSL